MSYRKRITNMFKRIFRNNTSEVSWLQEMSIKLIQKDL